MAFDTLKKELTTAPILAFPDFTEPFILDADASSCGLGVVLAQTIGRKEQVVAFASRTLTKAERRYCATRREMLALSFSSLSECSRYISITILSNGYRISGTPKAS